MTPICRQQFNAQELVADNPAELHDWNKKVLFDLCAPANAIHNGTITFTRWGQLPMPRSVTREMSDQSLEFRDRYFDYGASWARSAAALKHFPASATASKRNNAVPA